MEPSSSPFSLSSLSSLSSHSLTLTCLGSRLRQVSTSCNLLLLLSFSWDLLLGLLAPAPPPSFSTSAHSAMEATVSRLQTLITWMMENPAGLKLSSVLSQALGQFFLYHIHLWVTYIMLLLPLITPHLINLLPFLQHLPLSLQVALAGDLFTLFTLHLHCFHAYARRLASCQATGLTALWRLFIGKKYNPLRDRVDSADCSVEQLFLGTIIFTILLFLFPTSLTFYAVFLALRTAANAVTSVFRAVIVGLHWLPSNKEII